MTSTTAIRAETVGSLLRPPSLRDALVGQFMGPDEGRLEELERLADQAVLEAIALQESAGIDVITDGEMRRFLFFEASAWLSGIESIPSEDGPPMSWKNSDGPIDMGGIDRANAVTKPIEITRPDFYRDEFEFMAQHAHTRTKVTLGAPSFMRVLWHRDHSRDAYPTVEDFMFAVRNATQQVARELVAMGCTYIQLDAPSYTSAIDPAVLAALATTGNKFGDLAFDAELDSSVFDGLEGVTRAIHLCRGNGPAGSWLVSGGYEAIAKELFPRLAVDRLLLEYDTSRAGGFEPLREVPEDVVAVLGLVTTKSGELEDADTVEARVREAAEHKSLETLAISPQCGFASSAFGNPLTHEDQEVKLRLVGNVARRIWG